ncbi:hypothetical protein JCM5350_001690 [Sporobolomyces pararoseus]
MDSPNASGYVPLSLVDTLTKPSRSYRSIQASTPSSSATPSLSSSRSYHHAHSASIHALAAKERSEQARREAAAISETLGLLETPGPHSRRTFNNNNRDNENDIESTPRPQSNENVSLLKSQLKEKDQEIATLRRELGIVNKDKKELIGKLSEQSKQDNSIRGGLDATQVEELVKQFNDQEALLGGYQREAEKSLAELDRLRNKERRLNDWFERMYGPSWAEELNLTDKPSLSSSPTIRTKLSSRPSTILLPTPTSSSSSTSSTSSIFSGTGTETPFTTTTTTNTTHESSPNTTGTSEQTTLSPRLLKQHLESIQSLIRGMETRLIARGVELELVEKRARSEARFAESKKKELEDFISSSNSNSSSAVQV